MIILLLSAGLPVVIFLVAIYRKDTIKEPPKMILKCFFFGCLATIPILFIEQFVSGFNVFTTPHWYAFYDAFITAALVEEGVKFLFLYWIIWKSREFDQYYDGIVYAVFISLGFAFIENILYVAEYGFGTAILRAVLSIPGHGLFGVAMGYFFALAKFSVKHKGGLLWLSFFVPFLFHGIYDFILMYIGESDNGLLILLLFLGLIALMIFMWRLCIGYIRKHHAKDSQALY